MRNSAGSSTNSLLEYAANLNNSEHKSVQVNGAKSQCIEIIDEIEARGKEDHYEKKALKGRLKSAEDRIKNLENILTKNTAKNQDFSISSSTTTNSSSVSGLTLTSSSTASKSQGTSKKSSVPTSSTFTLSSTANSSFPTPQITDTSETSEADISITQSSPLVQKSSTFNTSFSTSPMLSKSKQKHTTLSISSSLAYTDSHTHDLTLSSSTSPSLSLYSDSSSDNNLATTTFEKKTKKQKKKMPKVAIEVSKPTNHSYSDSLSDVSSSLSLSKSSDSLYSTSSSESDLAQLSSKNSYDESSGSYDSIDSDIYPVKEGSPTRCSLTIKGTSHHHKSQKYSKHDEEIRNLLKEAEQRNKLPQTKASCISEVITDLEKYTEAKFIEMDSILGKIEHRNEKARIQILEKENRRMKKNLKLIKKLIHAIKKKRTDKKIDELFCRVSEKDLLQHIATQFHDFLGENEDISRETAIKLVNRVSKQLMSKQ